MFDKSGEKIKKVSTTVFYINLAIAMIVAIIAIFSLSGYGGMYTTIPLLIVAAIIVMLAWVSSLFLYAFGDLVESNQQILDLLKGKGINNNIVNKNITRQSEKKVSNNIKNDIKDSYFCEQINLFESGIITKEEFIEQKRKKWPNTSKILNDKMELAKIKQAYEQGLFSEQEYEEIKEATLNPESQIVTWYVEFDESIIPGVKIKALKNASDEEIEQLVRDQKYTSKIKKIYPLKNE